MNKNILYALLFLLFYGNQTFCISSSKYAVSKDELMSICKSSIIANFPIDIEMIRSFPIDDSLLAVINDRITDFWEEYEQRVHEIGISNKEYAYQLLAKKNIDMKTYIQNMNTKDPQVKSLAWIIWGYALFVIHFQIVHTIA